MTLYTKLKPGSPDHLKITNAIDAVLKPHVFSRSETLEELLLKLLAEKRISVSFAESCTGGLCVQRMIQVAGSSKHVWGGYTAYQLGAKSTMLGVKVASEEEGVSAECTRALAQSALKASQTGIAAAITGYLGPTGGTESDPIGTLYLCVADKKGIEERKIVLPPRGRVRLQWAAATHLLHLVRKRLLFV